MSSYIAYLTGTVAKTEHDLVIMTPMGVGYRVMVSEALLGAAQPGSAIELHIYHHVKEDAQELFGFKAEYDLKMFELLLAVSGVGPKTALQLTSLGSETLINAVRQADTSVLSSVPRVGKKLAQKIIIELTSKLGSMKELSLGPETDTAIEVRAALESLGFEQERITKALSELDTTGVTPVETVLRLALKQLNS
jgi:holliday junction DNA helicase RuvA